MSGYDDMYPGYGGNLYAIQYDTLMMMTVLGHWSLWFSS